MASILKLSITNIYKEFSHHIRKISYKDVYIILGSDIMPKLKQYVTLVHRTKFEDGSYQCYYGKLKKYISSYLIYWNFIINEIIVEADKWSDVADKDTLLILVDRTIDIHIARQIDFASDFLPVLSPFEKFIYEEIEKQYNEYLKKLHDLKRIVQKLDKKEKVDNFAKEHFKLSIKMTSELFEATHDFISMMLTDRINNIRVSLEEILLRVGNNLRSMQTQSDEALDALRLMLYDKNKQLLEISRQYRTNPTDYAEINHGIEKIRAKIAEFSFDPPLSRLQVEVAYWQTRVDDFNRTTAGLLELLKDQEEVAKQEQVYNSMKTTELPGSKKQCWLNMGENFSNRRKYLDEKILEAAKLLVTFFAIRGTDRIFYTDDHGQYYVDEFNHKVYIFDYGLKLCHRTCNGQFLEVSDKHKYYFDTFGRYIVGETGEKVYQCAECTSQYQLAAAGVLQKTAGDCGHSDNTKQEYCLHVKDAKIGDEILPQADPIETKGTLAPEVAEYLWGSLGHVLPAALHDAGLARSHNPLHHLAHCLLFHKYNKSKSEIANEMKQSTEYRDNILKERKEQVLASRVACLRSRVRSDDADDAAHAQVASHAYDALYLN